MVSKPQTRAEIIDAIESVLADSTNTNWTAARLGLLLDEAIVEISNVVPYVMKDVYQIETRRGATTSTSANNLVDATRAQFASGDTGKTVYNITDKTWAVITSFSSSSQVGLSRNIMASGEEYEIYNESCVSRKQINIDDSSDFLKVLYAFYPADRAIYGYPFNRRNITLTDQNKIIEIDVDYLDDTKDADANKDVEIYFARQHKINEMTDLLSEVDLVAGYSAGDTSMVVDGLQATGTIYKDTLFYFTQLAGNTANSRLVYRVTANATIAANEATISFFPSLECNVSDNDDITFVRSTLTPELEGIAIDMIVGKALMSRGIERTDKFNIGGTATPSQYFSMGERILESAGRKLKALVDVDIWATYTYSRA